MLERGGLGAAGTKNLPPPGTKPIAFSLAGSSWSLSWLEEGRFAVMRMRRAKARAVVWTTMRRMAGSFGSDAILTKYGMSGRAKVAGEEALVGVAVP